MDAQLITADLFKVISNVEIPADYNDSISTHNGKYWRILTVNI